MKNLLALVAIILLSWNNLLANNYYFSALSGDDSRTSTQAQSSSTPWQTLGKLNSFFSTLSPGDSVFLKRGETFYGYITINKSGTSGSPIYIGDYGSGAKPVITGLVTVSGFSASGSVWTSSATSTLGATCNVVLQDGILQQLGRYPNASAANGGYLTYEATTSTSITDNQLTTSPYNWNGATVARRTKKYSFSNDLITGHTGGVLSYSTFTGSIAANFGYFIIKDPRTLDVNGEFYYDASLKKIKFFSSTTPGTIKASAISDLLTSTGFNYITLNNLSFYGANNDAIGITNAAYFTIKNSDIIYCAGNGIHISGSGNTNNIIDGCTTNYCFTNGILLSNLSASAVRNCTIRNSGVNPGMQTGAGQIFNGINFRGTTSTFENNIITNTGYCPIFYVPFTGGFTGMTIQNNVEDSFCTVSSDGGGLYTYNGGQATCTGIVAQYNVISNGIGAPNGSDNPADLAAEGIYLDEASTGHTINGNTVYNCDYGYFGNYTNNSTLRDNVFYNNRKGQVYLKSRATKNERVRSIVFKNNWLLAYSPAQKTLYLSSDSSSSAGDVSLFFSSCDSNYYARPLDDNYTIYKAGTNTNLAGWQGSGYDAHGKKSPKTYTTAALQSDSLLFITNKTSGSQVINLANNFKDITGVTLADTILMKGYSSNILFKQPGVLASRPEAVAPTISLSIPGGTSYTAPANIYMVATAADADGTVSNVKFYNGNTLLLQENKVPYECTWSNVPKGTYVVKAIATDNGGFTTASSLITITVGQALTAPTILIDSPAVNDKYNASANVRISAVAADADGTISTVKFYINDTLANTQNISPYAYTDSNVSVGTYTITAKATDNSGLFTYSLPVVFSVTAHFFETFTGALSGDSVNLAWTAINYNTVAKYEVLRWRKRISKRVIGSMLPGTYTSFTFTDTLPTTGDNYYQIRKTGTDGKYTYSNVVTVHK